MRSLVWVAAVLVGCSSGSREPGDTQSAPTVLTAQEVIQRAAENWGGQERVAAIRTMSADFTYDVADGPVTHDIGRPSLVRSTGGERYVSVFDGQRAAFLRQRDRQGNPREPYAVDPDEAKDWELEKAWVFPAFFDHPAEYLGTRDVGGRQAHVLRVQLPLGARADYLLDGDSFLILRIEGLATMGGTTYASARDYSDYRAVDGVQYPSKFTYVYGEGEPMNGTIGSVAFNVDFPADYFEVPEALR